MLWNCLLKLALHFYVVTVENKIFNTTRHIFTAGAVVGIPMQQSAAHQGSVQHSHPMLGGRRGQGRRLPPTPCKPSTLQLRPGTINFPKLNASPTHVSIITLL